MNYTKSNNTLLFIVSIICIFGLVFMSFHLAWWIILILMIATIYVLATKKIDTQTKMIIVSILTALLFMLWKVHFPINDFQTSIQATTDADANLNYSMQCNCLGLEKYHHLVNQGKYSECIGKSVNCECSIHDISTNSTKIVDCKCFNLEMIQEPSDVGNLSNVDFSKFYTCK
ncbi:MAG: hypothetical protein ACP5NW_01645 [Candidatus Woesearchaeota archaeon]